MTRNLKATGLCLLAAFAMSALLASGAQATTNPLQWTAEEYPAVLTGEAIQHKVGEAPVHTFTTSGGAVLSCEKMSFDGTIQTENGHAPENVTMIPTVQSCSAKIGASTLPFTYTMEDCDYVYHGGQLEEGQEHTFKGGTTDLVCPPGVRPTIHIYQTAAKHAANESLCTLSIAPYTNKGEITYHNVTGASDDIVATTTIPGIVVTRTGSLLCGPANQTTTFTGSTTWKAFEDLGNETPSNGTLKNIVEGEQLDLTVSETP